MRTALFVQFRCYLKSSGQKKLPILIEVIFRSTEFIDTYENPTAYPVQNGSSSNNMLTVAHNKLVAQICDPK